MTGAHDRSRRRVLTADEAKVWRAVTRDVTPLAGREVVSVGPEDAPPPPAPAPLPPVRDSAPPPRPRAPLPDLAHGRAAGLDRRTSERMAKGEMGIDGRIDLHGLTQDMAHAGLSNFVARAYDRGWRCVLVITGKGRDGGGILRAQVPRWLNLSPLRERILGFSYARPQHGGDGAIYVLIKRRRA